MGKILQENAYGQRIALITDSCADVPAEEVKAKGIIVVPLAINYSDASYRDGVDITPDEVYARFAEEIPKTSLPAPAEVAAAFDGAIVAGATHILAVTIASGLSGTHDLMRSVAAGYAGVTCEVVDTKSIGLGAGISVLAAAELIERGLEFSEVLEGVHAAIRDTSVFFCVDTLEYLYKGGRIGKVTYSVGSAFDIRPVVTCEREAGIYVTAGKAHGRKASLKKVKSLALKALEQVRGDSDRRYRFAVVHGGAEAEARALYDEIAAACPEADRPIFGQITPALVVHTGPGLIGVGVQVLD